LKREITSFDRTKQAPGKSPEECFAFLKVLRRRYLQVKPEKRGSLKDDDIFGYLLDRLKESEWRQTINTLDAQPNLDMEDKLDSLQRLWDITPSLKGIDNEEAFVARGRWPKSQLRTQRVQSHSPENQGDFWNANHNNR
ncbi:hypothetical protein EPUL_006737, partial [Erysiphe pulchra]